MRFTLSLFICALAVACVAAETNSSLVVRGIIEGIATAQNWGSITTCLSTNDALYAGFTDAIATFNINNSATITPAAIKLGRALQKIPTALQSCNASVGKVREVVGIMSRFASLSDYITIIGTNIAKYNVDLIKESYQASHSYYQGQMKDFGNKIGMAMAQVFFNGTGKSVPRPDANTTSVHMLVSQGFFEGFTNGLKWSQVKACMTGRESSQKDMTNAIAQLQSEDPQIFANGIGSLGNALVEIPQAIADCTGARDKALNLATALASLQDFETYVRIVGMNAAVSGIDIYEAIYTSTVDLKVGAYKDFGTNVGLAVSKLFFDNVQATRK